MINNYRISDQHKIYDRIIDLKVINFKLLIPYISIQGSSFERTNKKININKFFPYLQAKIKLQSPQK